MSLSLFNKGRIALPSIVLALGAVVAVDRAQAQIVVAEDFFYDQVSDPGDTFTGDNKFLTVDYGGGQNGPLGSWDTRWTGFGAGAIVSSDLVDEPFASNQFTGSVNDQGGSGGADLSRPYNLEGAGGLSTLYFAADFLADDSLSGADMFAGFSPFNVSGDDRAGAVTIGIANNTFFGSIGDTVVEGDTGVAADGTNDESYHRVVGKLELNAGGFNAADYNQDGAVNALDYGVYRDTFGSTSDLRADGDGSGEIDAADRDFWAANYGGSALDRLTVFIDPTAADTSAGSTLTVEGALFESSFDDGSVDPVAFISGFIPDNEAASGRRHFVDNVVIGATFDDVAAVAVPRLTAEVNTATGDVTLVNNSGTDIDLVYYEINSESGSLDSAGWNSLEDQTVSGWAENSGTDSFIVESNFLESSIVTGDGGSLALGTVFDTTGTEDLVVRFGTLGGTEGLLNLAEVVTVASAAGVPEPTALLLAVIGGVALVRRR